MYRKLLSLIAAAAFMGMARGEGARLLRFPAMGENQIAFSYAGNLYSVPLTGGTARQLTSHEGQEIFPRFSADGQQLAFTGQFDGNTEVYLMPAEGGIPQRLTHTATLGRDDLSDRMGPNNIVMGWSPDGQIVYRSRQHSFNSFKGQLFKVPTEGGLSAQIEVPEGGFLSFSPDGKKMAYNRVFREFRTWKYYQGGMADDVWVHDFETRETVRITNHPAQDLMPMWIGNEIFFISDRDRTMNLFAYNTTTRQTEKVTHFEDYDIKFPSHNQSHIVFEKGGLLYTFNTQNRKLQQVPVQIRNDQNFGRSQRVDATKRITSISLSPQGERALFSARGEVFSVPAEKGITYNLTRSSGIHERDASWSPDGSKVTWLSDKSGEYEIWISDGFGEELPRQLTSGADTYKFNLSWSPDGTWLAWNDQHFGLYLTNTESGHTHKVAQSKLTPLNQFNWSPDSQWLTYTDYGDNRMGVVHVLNTNSGESFPITDPWYHSYSPAFSHDGKYLLFGSDRTFNPIYGDTEWNHAYVNMGKIYLVLLAEDTPSPFAPQNQLVAKSDEDNNAKGKSISKENKKPDEQKEDSVPPVTINYTGIARRILEVPVEAGNFYNLNLVNGKIYYNRQIEGKEDQSGLTVFDLKEQKETFLGDYNYTLSAKGNKMLLGKDQKWSVVDLPATSVQIDKPMDLTSMQVQVNYAEEWQQIYDEAWRQMRDFFYVDNMHGVDWQSIYEKYQVLVPHVQHRADLNYIIGEMIGELNAGHAYVNPGDQPSSNRIQTGLLGARFSTHESGYFRIDRILEGAPWSPSLQAPLNQPGLNIRQGDYLIAVNRVSVTSVSDPYELLIGTAGKTVELTINSSPTTEGARQILVTPVADESSLYYFEWVQNRIRKVEEASGGQIGYLHIPDMGPGGLNEFVKYFYPQLNKKALIIDDRGNGGGNVSPMILERLSRTPYRVNMRRNTDQVSTIPAQTLAGPKVALIDKYSASDGDLFAFGFKELGLGKLIGTRTWGGIVGITGPLPFIDGTDLRVPQFTSLSMDGDWMIEGEGVTPDIEVENDPYKEFLGEDQQLNKAIEVLLEELKERKDLPGVPAPPVK